MEHKIYFIEKRREYLLRLKKEMNSVLFQFYQDMYISTKKKCTNVRFILKNFQDQLRTISKWSSTDIEDRKTSFKPSVPSLIENIFKTFYIIEQSQEPEIDVDSYIHHLFLHIARKLYKNPFIVYDVDVSSKQKHENNLKLQELIDQEIENTFIEMLPFEPSPIEYRPMDTSTIFQKLDHLFAKEEETSESEEEIDNSEDEEDEESEDDANEADETDEEDENASDVEEEEQKEKIEEVLSEGESEKEEIVFHKKAETSDNEGPDVISSESESESEDEAPKPLENQEQESDKEPLKSLSSDSEIEDVESSDSEDEKNVDIKTIEFTSSHTAADDKKIETIHPNNHNIKIIELPEKPSKKHKSLDIVKSLVKEKYRRSIRESDTFF